MIHRTIDADDWIPRQPKPIQDSGDTRGREAVKSGDRVLHEARRHVALGLKRTELLPLIGDLAACITLVPEVALESMIARCEETLGNAVASGNGSVRDAHVLALAWSIDGDIWTTDRDFAGTRVATWSTLNLMRGLADAAAFS